jgi:hypothetical protein
MRRAIGGARGGPKASVSVLSGLPSSLSESVDAHSSGVLERDLKSGMLGLAL